MGKIRSGKGPVIRVGDRATTFDRDAENLLLSAKDDLEVEGKSIQRDLMPGGQCEALVYKLAGYTVSGIAIPLLNYHNYGKGGFTEEAVNINDVELSIELLVRSIEKFDLERDNIHRKKLNKIFEKYKSLGYIKNDVRSRI
jgi:putative aminopeptidase FrvX